jgi:excisionase family DNA binding protein
MSVEVPPELIDGKTVAKLTGVSLRHFRRLVDLGLAPPPVRLGRVVRWSRAALEQWIAAGCLPVRKGGVA